MVSRPRDANPFTYVVVASLRAAQLMRGCVPRVEAHAKAVVTAQREVSAGVVSQNPDAPSADAA